MSSSGVASKDPEAARLNELLASKEPSGQVSNNAEAGAGESSTSPRQKNRPVSTDPEANKGQRSDLDVKKGQSNKAPVAAPPAVKQGGVAADEKKTTNSIVPPTPAAPAAPARPPVSATVKLQVRNLLDKSIAEQTIDALLLLKLHKEENSAAFEEFKSTNICLNLVRAMEHNARSGSIQCKSCSLILNLTGKLDDPHFARGLRGNGVCKVVCQAMNAYPEHETVQQNGCLALKNLSYKASHADIKQMVDDGVIDAVLSAIDGQKESFFVRHSCGCLSNILIHYPACANRLMNQGCIESVLAAMENHLDDAEVQRQACYFLLSMVANTPKAKILIKEKGGAIALAKTEHHYRRKDRIIETKAGELIKSLF
jgi:hypothetical protein